MRQLKFSNEIFLLTLRLYICNTEQSIFQMFKCCLNPSNSHLHDLYELLGETGHIEFPGSDELFHTVGDRGCPELHQCRQLVHQLTVESLVGCLGLAQLLLVLSSLVPVLVLPQLAGGGREVHQLVVPLPTQSTWTEEEISQHSQGPHDALLHCRTLQHSSSHYQRLPDFCLTTFNQLLHIYLLLLKKIE